MRLSIVTIKDGKKRIHWPLFAAFVLTTYATVLGAFEGFWYGLAGGPSPLVGLVGLVVATLIVIRVAGAHLAKPADLIRAEMGTV